jgi:hypothetical protein
LRARVPIAGAATAPAFATGPAGSRDSFGCTESTIIRFVKA